MTKKNRMLHSKNCPTLQVRGLKIVENHWTAYVDVSLTYPEWGILGSSSWGMHRGCKQRTGFGKDLLAELGSIVDIAAGIAGIAGGSL